MKSVNKRKSRWRTQVIKYLEKMNKDGLYILDKGCVLDRLTNDQLQVLLIRFNSLLGTYVWDNNKFIDELRYINTP